VQNGERESRCPSIANHHQARRKMDIALHTSK
jgi:hypothetical protein